MKSAFCDTLIVRFYGLIILGKCDILNCVEDKDKYSSYTYAVIGAYVSTSRLKAHYEYL